MRDSKPGRRSIAIIAAMSALKARRKVTSGLIAEVELRDGERECARVRIRRCAREGDCLYRAYSPPFHRVLRSRALSSAVEHFLDMEGVRGSIPLAPTIAPQRFQGLERILALRAPRMRRSATAALNERGGIFEHAGTVALQPLRFPTIGRASIGHSLATSWLSPHLRERGEPADDRESR